MLLESRAIVLHRKAYNDRYHIVHLYTERYGRLGVLQSASHRGRSRSGRSSLPILAEIDLVAELKQGKQLATIKEVKTLKPRASLQMNPIKCSQGIFISELLYRILQEEVADEQLYHYINESLEVLEYAQRGVANFYLCFTYHLLYHLAIEPQIERRRGLQGLWFDLKECHYTSSPGLQTEAIPPQYIEAMLLFSRITYGNMHHFAYNREVRRLIIDYLLLYCRLHLPPFPSLKSLDILRGQSPTRVAQNSINNSHHGHNS